MSDTFLCAHCSSEHPADQCTLFDDHPLCPTCLEEETVLCRHCGERLWAGDNAGTEQLPLCQHCYDDYYVTCERCGALIHRDIACYEDSDAFQETPYCSHCLAQMEGPRIIHDYYYKPIPVFHGTGPRFFGVELEMDDGGESNSNARALLDIANRQTELAYIKHDGSLNDGLELVTHPLSLDVHTNTMPWDDLCRKAISMGYLSHRISTCGLHIHVSRTAFGSTPQEQDPVIARVLFFFEKHWEELLKFSRRTQRQLERWAARYGYKDRPMEILDYAKTGTHAGRYTCVNLQNRDTVEFRMFRGTLKSNTILATLQLLDRICDVALFLSDEQLRALAWTSFVSGISPARFPQLVQYLKERQLYINDPVEREEDL